MSIKTVRVSSRLLSSCSADKQRTLIDTIKSDFPAFQVSPVTSPELYAVPFEYCQDYDAAHPAQASRYLTRSVSTILDRLICDYPPRGFRLHTIHHPRDVLHLLLSTKAGVKHLRGTFAALLFVPTDSSFRYQAGHAIDLLTFQPDTRTNLHKDVGLLVWRTHRHVASAHAQNTTPDHVWTFHTDWTPAELDKRLDAMLRLTSNHELRPLSTHGYLLPEAMPKVRVGYYDLARHAAKCAANQWLAVRRGEIWETVLTFTNDKPSAYTEQRTYVYTRSASPDGHYDLSTEWQLAALCRAIWDFDADLYATFMQACMYRLQVGEQFSHTLTL